MASTGLEPRLAATVLTDGDATWRLPSRADRERDRRYLRAFLLPEVADAIASMPCVVVDPPASFADRCDAWLYRTDQPLRAVQK